MERYKVLICNGVLLIKKIPRILRKEVSIRLSLAILIFLLIFSTVIILILLNQNMNQRRVLCYVLLSQNKLKAAKVIQETWGRHCDKLIFFGNYSSVKVPITFLSGNEGYPYLWNKTKSALIYMDSKYSEVKYATRL